MKPASKLREGLLLSLGSVVFILVVLEVGVRLIWGAPPKTERFRLHPRWGWSWASGYERIEPYFETEALYQISRQGLRNPTIEIPKPANTFRIIVLGDSITEGPGVALEYTFVKQLQAILQAKYSTHPIEVINAGTGDYATEQEWLWLQEEGLRYEPDLVIVEWYLNDWIEFLPPSALVAIAHNAFIDRSAAYTYYFRRSRARLAQRAMAEPGFRFKFSNQFWARDWVHDSAVLTALIESASGDWGGAWDETRLAHSQKFLLDIQGLAREHDFDFVLVLFPVSVQVEAEVETPLDLDYPQRQMLAFAGAHGIAVLDLVPILRESKGQDIYFDQAHYRPIGHQLIAQALAEFLSEADLIPSD